MANDQIAVFQRARLPDYCFVTEAALWVAFAQIPVLQEIDTRVDGEPIIVDFRGCQDAFDEGMISDMNLLSFSEDEFNSKGIDIELDKYNRGIFDVPVDFIKQITEISIGELDSFHSEWDRKISEAEKYAHRLNEKLAMTSYPSWEKVYEVIASGRLSTRGWLIDKEKSDEEGYDVGRLTDLLPDDWSLWDFRLDKSSLKTNRGEFLGVQVPTLDMIGLFPKPDCELVELNGATFGDTVIVNERAAGRTQKSPRSRGRPPKAQSSAKDIVARFFGNKILQGQLPAKDEASLQEIVEFVSIAFDQKISRTSAQNYMKAAKKYASFKGARN